MISTTSKRRRCRKVLFGCFAGVACLVLVIIVAGKLWLLPALVRGRFTAELLRFWGGTVRIGEVHFDLSGTAKLRRVALYDMAGREWLNTETVKLGLSDWPGLKPKINIAEIGSLRLTMYSVDGGLKIPIRRRNENSGGGPSELDKLSVHDAQVIWSDKAEEWTIYDKIKFAAVRKKGIYDVTLTRPGSDALGTFLIGGTIDPATWETNLSLEMTREVGEAETGMLFALFGIPQGYQAKGNLSASVKVSGFANEPAGLHPKGLIGLRNWAVASKDQPLLEALTVDVVLDGANIQLENLMMADGSGNELLVAKTVRVSLEHWPSVRPKITEIETFGLKLPLHLERGKSIIPHRLSGRKGAAFSGSSLPLRKLVMHDTSIRLIDKKGPNLVFDKLLLQATKQDKNYAISVIRDASADANSLFVSGTVNPKTTDVNLSLRTERFVTAGESGAAFSLSNMPSFLSASGKLAADAKITGKLTDKETLWPLGRATLKGWVLSSKDKVVTKDLNAEVGLSPRRLDFQNINSVVCGGQVSGSFYADLKESEIAVFGGEASGQGIDLAKLTEVLPTAKKMKKGIASFSYSFTATASDLQSLEGQGILFLNDADIHLLPVVPLIFRAIGLVKLDPGTMSDATVVFEMTGPNVTLRRGRLTNRLSAIEAEPGGTVNLKTGAVDFYVVGASLKHIRDVLKAVPIVNLFANLKDRLFRLHIKGHWSDAPAKLITKEPIKDVREGTVDFLRGVVDSGGQLTQKMRTASGDLYKGFRKSKSREEDTGS